MSPLDTALATVEQVRDWHQPYAGKPCGHCLVADGWTSCATSTALADVALRLRIAGAAVSDPAAQQRTVPDDSPEAR